MWTRSNTQRRREKRKEAERQHSVQKGVRVEHEAGSEGGRRHPHTAPTPTHHKSSPTAPPRTLSRYRTQVGCSRELRHLQGTQQRERGRARLRGASGHRTHTQLHTRGSEEKREKQSVRTHKRSGPPGKNVRRGPTRPSNALLPLIRTAHLRRVRCAFSFSSFRASCSRGSSPLRHLRVRLHAVQRSVVFVRHSAPWQTRTQSVRMCSATATPPSLHGGRAGSPTSTERRITINNERKKLNEMVGGKNNNT